MKINYAAIGNGILRFFKMLGWLIPIAAVGIAAYFVFRGTPSPEYTRNPGLLMSEYMKLVLPFMPPQPLKPDRAAYNELLNIFTKEDRKWIEQNAGPLSWLGMNQDTRAYLKADEMDRLHARFKFIIAQGPREASSVQGTKFTPDGKSATILCSTATRQYEVMAILENQQWRFKGVWGIPSRFATQLAQFAQTGIK